METPSIKALLRDSQSPSIIHCIRPYQGLIGGVGIVPLDFHDDGFQPHELDKGISHGCLQLLLYGVWCFEGGMVDYDGL